MKELIKLIMRMLKEDPEKLAAIRDILGEMKWLLAGATFCSAFLILCAVLAACLKALFIG